MKWNHSFKNIFSSSSLRLFVTLKKKEIRNYDVANKQSVIINITHSMNEKILVQIVIMDMKRIKISLSLCAGVFGFWRLFFLSHHFSSSFTPVSSFLLEITSIFPNLTKFSVFRVNQAGKTCQRNLCCLETCQ